MAVIQLASRIELDRIALTTIENGSPVFDASIKCVAEAIAIVILIAQPLHNRHRIDEGECRRRIRQRTVQRKNCVGTHALFFLRSSFASGNALEIRCFLVHQKIRTNCNDFFAVFFGAADWETKRYTRGRRRCR